MRDWERCLRRGRIWEDGESINVFREAFLTDKIMAACKNSRHRPGQQPNTPLCRPPHQTARP